MIAPLASRVKKPRWPAYSPPVTMYSSRGSRNRRRTAPATDRNHDDAVLQAGPHRYFPPGPRGPAAPVIGDRQGCLGGIFIGFAGYAGPSLFGLGAARLIQLGHSVAGLWVALFLLGVLATGLSLGALALGGRMLG